MLPLTTKVPHTNSLDPDEMPRNFAFHPDSSCLHAWLLSSALQLRVKSLHHFISTIFHYKQEKLNGVIDGFHTHFITKDLYLTKAGYRSKFKIMV